MPHRQREIALAQAATRGDAQAFTALAESIRLRLTRYSRLVCRQPDDADEVVQETLLQVFQRLGELREPRSLHSWVFRIALNQCRRKRRRSAHEPRQWLPLEACDFPAELPLEPAAAASSPEDAVLMSESKEVLESAILQLPEVYREVVLLRCLEGLSTEETAAALETSPDVVRTRLHRARLAIRERLGRGGTR